MWSSCSLWVILFLGICMGMVTATAREPKSENVGLFGRRWPPIPWWRLPWRVYYPNYPPLPPPPPSFANVIPPTVHMAPPPPPPLRVPPPPPLPSHTARPPPHMAPPSPLPSHAATSVPPQPPPSLPPIDDVAPILPLPRPPPAFHSPVVNKPPSTQGDEPSDCSMVLISVDGCVSDLITSFFKDQVSLSIACCRVISRISDDCFDAGFTHFRVPVLLTKVRDYCSHHPTPPPLLPPPSPSVANAVPPPPPSQYVGPPPPWHMAPSPPPQLPSSPPPVDNVAPIPLPPPLAFHSPVVSPPLPSHTATPPMPPHAAPSLSPQPPPSPPPVHGNMAPIVSPPPSSAPRGDEKNNCSTVLISVDGCVSDLITSFFKDQVSLSADCCRVVSRISDDCFDRAFTHFRVPVFLAKVRDYCSHQR